MPYSFDTFLELEDQERSTREKADEQNRIADRRRRKEQPGGILEAGVGTTLKNIAGRAGTRLAQRVYGAAETALADPRMAAMTGTPAGIALAGAKKLAPRAVKSAEHQVRGMRKAIGEIAAEKYPMSEASQAVLKGEQSWWKSPSYMTEVGADAVAEMIPLVVATMAGQPQVGLAYMSTGVGLDSRNEAYDRLKAAGYSDEAANQRSMAKGAIDGLVTQVTSKWLTVPYLKGNGRAQNMLFQSASNRLANHAARIAAAGSGAAAEEALQEVLEGTAQDVTQRIFEEDPDAFDDFVNRRIQEAFFGGTLGSMFGSVAGVRPTQLEKTREAITHILAQPDGLAKLENFSQNDSPSRKDAEAAGLGTARLNDSERAIISKASAAGVKAARDVSETIDNLLAPGDTTNKDLPALKRQDDDSGQVATTVANKLTESTAIGQDFSTAAESLAPPKPTKPLLPEWVTKKEEAIGAADLGIIDAVKRAMAGQTEVATIIPERARRGLRRVGQKIASGFRPRGKLPYGTMKAKERGESLLNRELKQSEFLLRDLQVAAVKEYGIKSFGELSQDASLLMQNAMTSDQYDALPQSLQKPAREMRRHVDRLSRLLIDEGVVDGMLDVTFPESHVPRRDVYEAIRKNLKQDPDTYNDSVGLLEQLGMPRDKAELVTTIIAKEGVYLNRSYRAFDLENWSELVSEETKSDFYNFLREEAEARGEPPPTDEEVARTTAEILFEAKQSGNPTALALRSGMSGKNLSILRKRLDMPRPLRELLGEYRDDPVVNYYKTIQKQAQLYSKHKMMEMIRQDGLEKGYLWNKDDANRPEEAHAQITKEGNPSWFPLDGMWGTEEFHEALKEISPTSHNLQWLRWMAAAEQYVTMGKVTYSPQAMVRQVPSNILYAVANGHSPTGFLNKLGDTWSYVSGLGSEAQRAKILEAIEYYVVGENVDVGLLRDLVGQTTMHEMLDAIMQGKGFGKFAKAAVKFPQKLYESIDAIFKLAAWEAEQEAYRKAFPEWSPAQIKEYTAEIVRQTWPTYSRILPILKKLKTNPAISLLISFDSEIYRNGINRGVLIAKELRDPRTRRIGLKRASGQILALLTPRNLAAAATAAAMFTRQDEEDVRELGPSFHKNTEMALNRRSSNGNISYTDIGYANPFGSLMEAQRAISSGKDSTQVAIGLYESLLEKYIRPKFTTEAAAQLWTNKDSNGYEIWLESDTVNQRLQKMQDHIVKKIMPTLGKSALKVREDFGESTEAGWDTLINEAFSHASGLRTTTLDPDRSLFYKARDYKEDMSNIDREFEYSLTKTPEAIAEHYSNLEDARKRTFRDMHDASQATLRLLRGYRNGYDRMAAKKTMRKRRISDEDADAIIDNTYTPYIPKSLDTIDAMLPVATPEHRELLLAAKKDKLTSLAWSASRITDNEDLMAKARRDKKELRQRFTNDGIFDYRGAMNLLVERIRAEDIRYEQRRLKKKIPKNEPNRDKLLPMIAAQRVNGKPVKWTKNRKLRAESLVGRSNAEKYVQELERMEAGK